jgi:PAS domain S-box-containing protein
MHLRTAADTRTDPAGRNLRRTSVLLAIGIGALAWLSYAWFSGSKHSGSLVAPAIANVSSLFFLVPVTLLASTIFLFVRSGWNRREELLSRQLRAEQERWALAVAANPDALYDADLTTGEVFRSSGWTKILGFQESEVGPTINSWKSLLHPEDAATALSRFTAHLQRETDYYEAEYRLRHKDGSWVWILDRAKAHFADNGSSNTSGRDADRHDAQKTDRGSTSHAVKRGSTPSFLIHRH